MQEAYEDWGKALPNLSWKFHNEKKPIYFGRVNYDANPMIKKELKVVEEVTLMVYHSFFHEFGFVKLAEEHDHDSMEAYKFLDNQLP